MIKNMDKATLRRLLDKVGYSTSCDKDGDYFIVLSADDDFDHDVVIYYMLNDKGCLRIMGRAVDFDVTGVNKARAILTCNAYNQKNVFMKAYVSDKDGVISIERCDFTDEGVSEEHMIENCIKMSSSLIWGFFCSFNGKK